MKKNMENIKKILTMKITKQNLPYFISIIIFVCVVGYGVFNYGYLMSASIYGINDLRDNVKVENLVCKNKYSGEERNLQASVDERTLNIGTAEMIQVGDYLDCDFDIKNSTSEKINVDFSDITSKSTNNLTFMVTSETKEISSATSGTYHLRVDYIAEVSENIELSEALGNKLEIKISGEATEVTNPKTASHGPIIYAVVLLVSGAAVVIIFRKQKKLGLFILIALMIIPVTNTLAKTIDYSFNINYTIRMYKPLATFADASWEEIQANVRAGRIGHYNVGDTKTVNVNGTDHLVRIANKSTPDSCLNDGFSQTACGFVVEFTDILEQRAMNLTYKNVGGWPATEMRSYLNGSFISTLPVDLQSAIIDTRVISGYGCNGNYDSNTKLCGNPDNGGTNFTSTDKIYLLSGAELLGEDEYDTAVSTTRRLDYYAAQPVEQVSPCGPSCGVLMPGLTGAIKQYNGSNLWWWLRGAYSSLSSDFRLMGYIGDLGNNYAYHTTLGGVSPAFRIG